MVSEKDKDNLLLATVHGLCGQMEDNNPTMMELAENRHTVSIHLLWFKQANKMSLLECTSETPMLLHQSLLIITTLPEQSVTLPQEDKLKFSSSSKIMPETLLKHIKTSLESQVSHHSGLLDGTHLPLLIQTQISKLSRISLMDTKMQEFHLSQSGLIDPTWMVSKISP